MELREALEVVINEAEGGCADYAKSYAQAALELGDSEDTVIVSTDNAIGISHKKTGKMMVGKELKVQLLYVLSNLSSWRGEKAREVKTVLKGFTK